MLDHVLLLRVANRILREGDEVSEVEYEGHSVNAATWK
jgi:hypothetical protein